MVRNDNHNLASPNGEKPLNDDIDVGEDATPEPKPSRTQQDIPDACRDAQLDVDLGSMTAQKWSQEQLQEPVCKSIITLLQQGLSGASLQDIILQFPTRVRPTVCVLCVFSSHSFWTSSSLDVPAGVTQEEGHTGFFIHLLSAVRALIILARRIQPFLSLVDREVEFCVLTI